MAKTFKNIKFFITFEKFSITSKILRILTLHIKPKDSQDSELQTGTIYSIISLSFLEAMNHNLGEQENAQPCSKRGYVS